VLPREGLPFVLYQGGVQEKEKEETVGVTLDGWSARVEMETVS
jgi:hypothetical protein